MDDKFKIQVCDKARISILAWNDFCSLTKAGILIKAMWAINRDDNSRYKIRSEDISCFTVTDEWNDSLGVSDKDFYFTDHNNSETEALTSALKYIFDNKE